MFFMIDFEFMLLFVLFQQGGLHPTADQIELFAYHLPKATLSNLIVSKFIILNYHIDL